MVSASRLAWVSARAICMRPIFVQALSTAHMQRLGHAAAISHSGVVVKFRDILNPSLSCSQLRSLTQSPSNLDGDQENNDKKSAGNVAAAIEEAMGMGTKNSQESAKSRLLDLAKMAPQKKGNQGQHRVQVERDSNVRKIRQETQSGELTLAEKQKRRNFKLKQYNQNTEGQREQRKAGREQSRAGRSQSDYRSAPQARAMTAPPFTMSFAPADRQLLLMTGAVPDSRLAQVRNQIKAHSDFSSELRRIDRKQHPNEAYFLKLLATGLAKNPSMSPAYKRDVIRATRLSITPRNNNTDDTAVQQ